MKKKQLLAFMMAGALSVSAVPYSAFAEEGAAAVSIDETAVAAEAPAADAATTEGQATGDALSAAPAATEAPAADQAAATDTTQTDNTVTETPAQTDPNAQAGTDVQPTEAPAVPDTTQNPDSTQDTDNIQDAVQDITEDNTAVDTANDGTTGGTTVDESLPVQVIDPADDKTISATYNNLQDAINGIADGSSTSEHPVKIILKQNIEINNAAVAVGNKHVIIAAGEADLTVKRVADYTGDLFTVDEGSLQFAAGVKDGSTVCKLTVDGGQAENVTGALVHIMKPAGTFGLQSGVTLQNNKTNAAGSAILNENGGTIVLTGGTIIGNVSTYTEVDKAAGGAIYSTGLITVAASKDAAGTASPATILIKDNTRTDGSAGNIVLNGAGAYVQMQSTVQNSEIHITSTAGLAQNQPLVVSAADVSGAQVVAPADMIASAAQMTYDDTNYKLQADPNTGAAYLTPATPVPTAIPVPTATPIPTVDPKPSDVPTATATPTPTQAVKKMKLSNKQNIKWTGREKAMFKFTADKNGRYYIAWNQDKSKIPSFKVSDAVSSFAADQTVTVNVPNITAEDGKDVYVYLFAVDDNNKKATPLRYTLKASARPAAAVVTREPIVPNVTESIVQGLDKALEFYPNQFYKFTVIGAGTASTAEQVKSPVEGDVQWRPIYWSTSKNPSAKNQNKEWQIGAKNGIKEAKTFKLYVFFQKYVYNGKEWQASDTVQSAAYTFRSAEITFEPSGTPSGTPAAGSGGYYGGGETGETGEDTDGDGGSDAASRDGDDSDTGSTSSASNASTADNSPIGAMVSLAALSLLAGGYVIVRRRKRA